MTDEQRTHANEQLRIDYQKAVADLTHARREARACGERFTEVGRQLVAEPESIAATTIRQLPTAAAVLRVSE